MHLQSQFLNLSRYSPVPPMTGQRYRSASSCGLLRDLCAKILLYGRVELIAVQIIIFECKISVHWLDDREHCFEVRSCSCLVATPDRRWQWRWCTNKERTIQNGQNTGKSSKQGATNDFIAAVPMLLGAYHLVLSSWPHTPEALHAPRSQKLFLKIWEQFISWYHCVVELI